MGNDNNTTHHPSNRKFEKPCFPKLTLIPCLILLLHINILGFYPPINNFIRIIYIYITMYVKSATIALSLMALNGASAFAPGKFSIVEFLSPPDTRPF